MAEIIKLRNNPHDEVQELLPWLVNGTLSPEESRTVDAHLGDCAECRADLDAERQLAAAVSALPLNAADGWERMEQRLDRQPSSDFQPRQNFWRRRIPIGWAIASPLAAGAAVGLIFVNVTPTQPIEPQYRALGSAAVAQPANLVVQFAPATRVSDMQQALASADARLVDGPTATGAYLLRVDRQKRELALAELRDNQAVAVAEPIDAPARE